MGGERGDVTIPMKTCRSGTAALLLNRNRMMNGLLLPSMDYFILPFHSLFSWSERTACCLFVDHSI